MKVVLIVALSTLISVSGIYVLREKVFKVNDQAPDGDIINDKSFYSLEANDIDGKTISFSKYKGKKVLIVNVASKCGLSLIHI